MRYSLISLLALVTLSGCLVWALSPSRARKALPASATGIVENRVGPTGITGDVLYELEATVTEEGFRSFSTKMNLTLYDQEQHSTIRNLPVPSGNTIVYVGDCSGLLLEWASFANGRMRYWDSIGY